MHRSRVLLAQIAAVSTLAACGGGGSSDASSATPGPAPTPVSAPAPSPATPPAPAPAPVAGPINTTPQTATYAAGSPEAAAFATLNAERGACGFGFLKQSAKLDLAATDANGYFTNRAAESRVAATSFGHIEVAGKTGYTGAYPADRAAYRGYVAADVNGVNEDNGTHYDIPVTTTTNLVLSNARLKSLLTTVYHLGDMLSPRTEVGLGFVRVTSADGADLSRLNLVLGRPLGDTSQAATAVRTYPCAGTTAVSGSFTPQTEIPNPAPDLAATVVGTPIYVNGPEGQTLNLRTATVVRTSDGIGVETRIITYLNDPVYVQQVVHMLTVDQAYVLPLAPLVAGTSYTVTLTGDSNGTAFTKTFAFTPGA